MRRTVLLLATHATALAIGFAAGIYVLPILSAPEAPPASELQKAAAAAQFIGQFRRDLKDSDPLHWGEGKVSIGARAIALQGRVSPGPAYKLYLSPEFVETKADFLRLKSAMAQVGDVKTFENFVIAVPEPLDVARYTSVVIWCEAFSQFITAARYR
ncbi:MAG TPA: DM13 domain-containing protein [Burkholderiales bacterium]|nr:DM13 domain-containing protein [Burkholderiales bacterium]